jgi:hypothetical protein
LPSWFVPNLFELERAAIRIGDKHACLDFMRDKPELRAVAAHKSGIGARAADDSAI